MQSNTVTHLAAHFKLCTAECENGAINVIQMPDIKTDLGFSSIHKVGHASNTKGTP